MATKQVRKSPIKLDLKRGENDQGFISFVGGARPYIWIGSKGIGCYGCVPDNKIERLRAMCDAILAKREGAE